MTYQRVTITGANEYITEILIALLSDVHFEGFEELPNQLMAYIPEDNFDVGIVRDILAPYALHFYHEQIVRENWNALWESNFKPVILEGFCTVRADFHQMTVNTPYEVVINPKMSFGTGHHATTQLMMQLMRDLSYHNKQVLDFGSGTGILGILAARLGADCIDAIDNESWAYENAQENAALNGVKNMYVYLGSLEEAPEIQYDILLANINRHILIRYMARLATLLVEHGALLLSGILIEDEASVVAAAERVSLGLRSKREQDGWIALHFSHHKS